MADIIGTAANNTLIGTDVDDLIRGLAGDDTLSGLAGNDTLDGGVGADSMSGGAGNDLFIVDNVGDTVVEAAGEGTDSVRSTISFSLATLANVENLSLLGAANINATSNAASNVLAGNAGNNVLNGGAGVDTVSYAAAAAGVTVNLFLGLQNTVGAGSDTLGGFENLTGSAFNDALTGNNLDNVIIAGGGDDVVQGAGGNDTLNGGAGSDTVIYTGATAGVTVNLFLGL